GKTAGHNLAIMRQLDRFASLGAPVVIGASRKSFIGKTLVADLDDRLAGSLACVAMAWSSGVDMVRVHDVKPTVQLLTMLEAIRGADASGR
ncbi:MAG: dihydropteroate synthase, partial [Candidatus Omnitrophota bacterium]|nr:dihydropteroate synthase [Candidatus Omnitrophota bacterium]